MEIQSILALEGANVYSSKPVIKMFLHLGSWKGVYTDEIELFGSKLTGMLPSISEHYCSRGKPGGFLERVQEGTLLGHVVEHVALELMNLAGQKVIYGKTLSTDHPAIYEIIMEYEVKEGAIQAARSAVKLVACLLQGELLPVDREIALIKQATEASQLGASTRSIVEACRKRDIPVIQLDNDSLLQLGYGKHQRRVEASISSHTSCIGVDIACDKSLTKKLLAEMGIYVPLGEVARSEEEALGIAARIGLPVVIKPHNGNHGKGVALNLCNEAEIRRAFQAAREHSDRILVERFIAGKHYRILVIGERVEAVAERRPASITGDGINTVRELIEMANSDQNRGDGHELPLTKIKLDSVTQLVLEREGYSLDSIPAPEKTVYLRDSANISTGGTAVDVTEHTHSSYLETAVRAARIIGLDIAGVDLVAEDITRESNGGVVIEVNAAPGLRMHEYPSSGIPRRVGEALVNYLFPLGAPSRIPVVSVSGTNGKTTTTRLIAHIMRQRNLMVGMTNSDGIWIGDKRIVKGDTTGPSSARVILRDPAVEAAVLETARGGILRAGLGYDYADVAVITNISEDHFGQYGIENLEDLAHVKSVVAEAVRRHSYVILNGDDPYVVKMAVHTRGRVILFSMNCDNPVVKQHLGTGGTAVFVKRGKIIVAAGDQVVRIGNVKSFPITLEGKALHNVQNLLAAVGAAWALGIQGEEIRNALNIFYSSPWHNPGRLNIFNVKDYKVMIDYGHNAAGIEQIIAFAEKLNPKRLIGVITVPGDRPNESIFKVGLLAGRGFDHLVIKEDGDLRGRSKGEVANILKSAALESGMKAERIKIILAETEAFRTALDLARTGDLVINFYEKLEPVLGCLEQYLHEHQLVEPGDTPVTEMVL